MTPAADNGADVITCGTAVTRHGSTASPHHGLGDADVAYLTVRDLAARWRTSPRTLERWRADGKGPAWVRLPGRVVYPLEDVLAYERAHRRVP